MSVIAKDDPEKSRRRKAAKIMSGVLKSTVGGIGDLIGDLSEVMSTDMSAMTTSLSSLGFEGAGAIASSFFGPKMGALKEINKLVILSGKYATILSNYLSVRISSAREAEYVIIKPIIDAGDVLMNKLDVEFRAKYSRVDDVTLVMNKLTEMTILAQFLIYAKSFPDLKDAFDQIHAQFSKQIEALSGDSPVRAFFSEYGFINLTEAEEHHAAYGCTAPNLRK